MTFDAALRRLIDEDDIVMYIRPKSWHGHPQAMGIHYERPNVLYIFPTFHGGKAFTPTIPEMLEEWEGLTADYFRRMIDGNGDVL
jgi:hypothetical protein